MAQAGPGVKTRLMRESGVSYKTVLRAGRDEPITNHRVIEALSAATGGKVSHDELAHPGLHTPGCQGEPTADAE